MSKDNVIGYGVYYLGVNNVVTKLVDVIDDEYKKHEYQATKNDYIKVLERFVR